MASTLTLARTSERSRSSLWVPGLLLFILAAGFMTVIMVGTSMAPGYDVQGGAISDLGVIGETAMLFNGALLAVGLLNIASGYLLYRTHGHAWVFAVFLLAGLGAIGAGLVPLNASDLHGIFALVAFVFFNVEALGAAALDQGPMRWVSVVAGLVGLAFVVIMVIGDAGNPGVFGPIGHGGAERMIVYPSMLWMMAFGGYSDGSPVGRSRHFVQVGAGHHDGLLALRGGVQSSGEGLGGGRREEGRDG